MMKSNHLVHETSPYLLQHAHNPVDWFAWSEAAFEKAKSEDKPILVSIGYAACHWCHVMEHESFENETTAEFMNMHFVNIKVDREERPDLDHIYMNACQLLTGAGGWPLNIFLTPDLKPFTGGTYYPPKPAYGKPSWMDVLIFVHETFKKERDRVEEQADLLSEHILKMDDAFIRPATQINAENIFSKEELKTAIANIKQHTDPEFGGFGNSPKFPGSMALKFLLRANYFERDEAAEKQVANSLNKMMNGGIYDHVGGGFSRYTTDRKWHIPHFEKMLYDNALLVPLFAEAFMITGNLKWKNVVDETLAFLEREMMHVDGGFYSSFDADSENEEGKFYTWKKEEIDNLFGNDSEFVCAIYDITEAGNWEYTNILHRTMTDEEVCEKFQLTKEELADKIKSVNSVLFTERNKRIKPGLDDKIILSWNAILCSAFVQAFKATGNSHYRDVAVNLIRFISTAFRKPGDELNFYHTWKNGTGKYDAMLEDISAFIQALLDMYEITGETVYLQDAEKLTAFTESNFKAGAMYYFTEKNQRDIPLRNQDFYDNATPSGNSVMMQNMIRLNAMTGNIDYEKRAEEMFLAIRENVIKHGTSFGNWLSSALNFIYPPAEIIVTGKNAASIAEKIHFHYYPNKTVQFDSTGENKASVFENRFDKNKDLIYICRRGECLLPVSNLQDFYVAMKSF